MTPARSAIETCVAAAVAAVKDEPGPLLEILHAVQNELGFVPSEAVPLIAEALNLSRAEVHGVVSFYHHFRERPAGQHTIQLCRAEACQAMNGNALAEFAKRRLQLDFGQTRADGKVTLEAVYCLGNCACAPSAMIDGQLRGRLDSKALADCADGWGVPA
ncbi:MAG TPA: formate dehydrogenase subunit gamma [Steroidobacteraceae bacterium]|nr:formate dehydrogenase subunit gamma [Steroidobacteraceae bacterium]